MGDFYASTGVTLSDLLVTPWEVRVTIDPGTAGGRYTTQFIGKGGKVAGAAAGDTAADGAGAAGSEAGAEPDSGAAGSGAAGKTPPDRVSGPDTPPAGSGD